LVCAPLSSCPPPPPPLALSHPARLPPADMDVSLTVHASLAFEGPLIGIDEVSVNCGLLGAVFPLGCLR
jgi:hypothetical protein